MENIDEKLKEILNRVRMKHFLSLRTLIYQGVAISITLTNNRKPFFQKKKDFQNLLSNIKI